MEHVSETANMHKTPSLLVIEPRGVRNPVVRCDLYENHAYQPRSGTDHAMRNGSMRAESHQKAWQGVARSIVRPKRS